MSWHGFEYTSPEDVLNNREKIQLFNSDVFNTNNCLDLISNIGHALFERYKITSGEVFHLQSILNDISDDQMSLAEDISKKNGWHNGFMLMKDFIVKNMKNQLKISRHQLIKIFFGRHVLKDSFFK